MKVLIISTNPLPASPSGPVYLAGAVRQAGHEVQIFERLFAADLVSGLTARLRDFQPDVVGISVCLVFGDEIDPGAYLGTRHTDLRPRVKGVTDIVRQCSTAQVVLGGPGFNYYAQDWLEYLGLENGLRGEGEEAFPLFLERLEAGGDIYAIPGCAFSCTYCPYSKLEGKRYRLKSPQRVLAEARHIFQSTGSRRVMFCDNNFNALRQHAESICQAWVKEQPGIQWGTGDLRPVGVDPAFCRLMEDSGCFYVNLAVESASEKMLRSMKRGYSVRQVRNSLEALSRSQVPFGASLMLGAPGEAPETIAETLTVLDDYAIPNGVWVTIEVYLWTDFQDILPQTCREGLLKDDRDLFKGAVYLSPGLPKSYLQSFRRSCEREKGIQSNSTNPAKPGLYHHGVIRVTPGDYRNWPFIREWSSQQCARL